MPRAFSDEERRAIQTRLLEQGEQRFAQYGLRKTTVEELAAAAGISKGAFYLFYESKEALLMDVVEEVEKRFRVRVLAAVEQPGPTPRARLAEVFRVAFMQWRTVPILRMITPSEFALMQPHIPAAKIAEHVEADQRFMAALAERCEAAGIPILIPPEQMMGLMYTVFFASLHEYDLGPLGLGESLALLLDLIAAYCVGEIETIRPQPPAPCGGR